MIVVDCMGTIPLATDGDLILTDVPTTKKDQSRATMF